MASRRSIKDLVRQETQKPSESEPLETAPPEISPSETTDAQLQTPPAINQKSAQKSTSSSRTSTTRRVPTKADLEALVKQLTSDLATAHGVEQKFQEQVLELQAELDEKNQLVTHLKDEIEQVDLESKQQDAQEAALQLSQLSQANTQRVEEMEGNLQDAKDAALQISQANVRLAQEIEDLKQENATLKLNLQELSLKQLNPQKLNVQTASTPNAQLAVSKPKLPSSLATSKLKTSDSKPFVQPQILHRPQNVKAQPGDPEDFSNSTWLL
ncbi:MAG: hypothetical protein ACRC8A_09090 [Microcoleaceae cyanobacterium]